MKTCSNCKIQKDLSKFSKNSSNKDGLSYECKECCKKRQKKWIENNRDHVNEYNRKYRNNWTEDQKNNKKKKDKEWREKNKGAARNYRKKYKLKNKEKIVYEDNKRRKIKQSVTFYISPKEVNRISNSPCFICGSKENIHVDHIIPIARGGRHSIGNLQPLCSYHNLRKGKMLMKEYMVKLSKEAIENE